MMNGKILTPQDFWEDFVQEFKQWWNGDPSLKDAYKQNKPWTCKITCFLTKLGKDRKYFPDYEWLSRIDVCYFTCCADDWAEWSCEAAIEHENAGLESSKVECSKLMSINAGLKVLITYYHENDAAHIEIRMHDYLVEFKRIYDSRKYHQEKDQYLFIILPDSALFDKGTKTAYAYIFDGQFCPEQPLAKQDIFSKEE